MALGSSAHQLEGAKSIVSGAAVLTHHMALLLLDDLACGGGQAVPVHGARKDDEDILAGRQIVAHVIQDGLAEAARVNAGGDADPVIAGQVAGTCFGDVQKLKRRSRLPASSYFHDDSNNRE